MTYQAPLLAIALILTLIYRNVAYKLEKNGRRLPLSVHYYVLLYMGFFVLTYLAVQSTYSEMKVTNWLDADKVRAQYTNDKDWEEAEKLIDMSGFQWLKTLSFSAPFWTVLTVMVCAFHTFQHVKAIGESSNVKVEMGNQHGRHLSSVNGGLHDRTIQILALPAVYGLMSMKSVVRVWESIANTNIGVGYQTWGARSEFLTSMYETNFMVADLYESWALYQFAELALAILNKGFKSREKELEKMGTDEKTQAQSDGKTNAVEQSIETGLSETLKDYEALAESVDQLTVQGIYSFIITCFVQSAWALVSTTLAYEDDLSDKDQLSIVAAKDKIKFFFLGMGLVASSAAISNIIVVEESFGNRLKDAKFFPSAKFWGTKVLVSLAFLQSLILYLPPFNRWSVTQQNLLYSSMLCLECFVVSLVHMMAWPAHEQWYGDHADKLTQPLLQ